MFIGSTMARPAESRNAVSFREVPLVMSKDAIERPPPASTIFGLSAAGAFLLIAGAAAMVFLPAREWREDRSAFDPAAGAFGEVTHEVGPDCPPVEHDEISCQVLGPNQWLWWGQDAKVAMHYPSGRRLPPAPGTLCTHTLADAERFGIVCVDDSGKPGVWMEEGGGWTRLSDPGELRPFVARKPTPASTTAGLVAAAKNTLFVWRPGHQVSVHSAPHAEQKIYRLTSGPRDSVSVASRVYALAPGRAALKVSAGSQWSALPSCFEPYGGDGAEQHPPSPALCSPSSYSRRSS